MVELPDAEWTHRADLAKLVEALQMRARLILLGDKDQLASVEAGDLAVNFRGRLMLAEGGNSATGGNSASVCTSHPPQSIATSLTIGEARRANVRSTLSSIRSPGGTNREIGAIKRHLLGALAADHHLEFVRVGPRGLHLVVEGNRLIHRGERMVAIGSRCTHLQCEVDFGRHPYADAGSSRRGG